LHLGTIYFQISLRPCSRAARLWRVVCPWGAGGTETDRLRTRHDGHRDELRHHRTHQSPCRCHSRTHHGAGHAGPTPRDATSSSEHKQDSTQTSHLTSPHSHKPAPSRRPRERRTSSVSDAPAYPQSYLCTRDVQRVPPLRLAHLVPATSPAAASAPWRHRQLLPLPSPAPSDG
jgi:hypothetical protein